MKAVWVCRCGSVHDSEMLVRNCDCTFNGYTHRFQCRNCGELYAKTTICCSLFLIKSKQLNKQTQD